MKKLTFKEMLKCYGDRYIQRNFTGENYGEGKEFYSVYLAYYNKAKYIHYDFDKETEAVEFLRNYETKRGIALTY
jgi:hypothetical protein